MELDFTPTGSVTLENEFEKVKKEGDKSYELGPNSQRADLVIEVVVSSGGIDKLEAYKRLQIPEFIITESTNSSPFLDELNRRTEISILNWSDYQTFIGVGTVQYITVKVGNQIGKGSNGTYTISHLLKAEGYEWNKTKKVWYRTYPAEGFSIPEYFNNANWISQAVGIEVRFYDDAENELAFYHID